MALSKNKIEDHAKAAAEIILSARDFCGNELEAVNEYCFENAIDFSGEFFCSARDIADQKWAKCRLRARRAA